MDKFFAIIGQLGDQAQNERLLGLMCHGYQITQRWQVASTHKSVLFCRYTTLSAQQANGHVQNDLVAHTAAEGDSVMSLSRIDNMAAVAQQFVADFEQDKDIFDTNKQAFNNPSFAQDKDATFIEQCYAKWGAEFCTRLEGDFSYVLWDEHNSQLHMARNAFNARSLYTLTLNNSLFVACDAKLLSQHPDVKVTVNKTAVLQWLSGRPDPNLCMFNEISLLPGGHRMVFSADGTSKTKQFWDIDPSLLIRYQSEDEYKQAFFALLHKSVESRLVSSAPAVFSQMSGGMDSTSVTSLANLICQKQGTALHTMSHRYQDTQSCDELDKINDMIASLNLKHSHFIDLDHYQSTDFSQLYPTDYDSPGIVLSPKYHQELALIKSLGADVLLTGNGGDETCWGHSATYRTRLYSGELGVVKEVVTASRELQQPVARTLYSVFVSPLVPEALTQLLNLVRGKPRANTQHPPWLGNAATEWDWQVTLENPYSSRFSPAKHARYEGIHTTSTFNSMRSYQKVADEYGVEVRHPFFDQKIVEFSFAIPEKMLIQGVYPKWLLRQTMQDYLPASICWNKHKTVFDHHFANLIRNNQVELRLLLSHTGLQDLGLLDNNVLLKAFDDVVNDNNKTLNVDMLYAILTQLWFQTHCEK
jgi:asparagine synthase (glutamine-hydrolysing)